MAAMTTAARPKTAVAIHAATRELPFLLDGSLSSGTEDKSGSVVLLPPVVVVVVVGGSVVTKLEGAAVGASVTKGAAVGA